MLLLLLTLIGLIINLLLVAMTTIKDINLSTVYFILFIGGLVGGIGIGNAQLIVLALFWSEVKNSGFVLIYLDINYYFFDTSLCFLFFIKIYLYYF